MFKKNPKINLSSLDASVKNHRSIREHVVILQDFLVEAGS